MTDFLMFLYFIIGIVYVVLNGLVRKMYHDDDWFLPFIHIILWPFFASMLIGTFIGHFIKFTIKQLKSGLGRTRLSNSTKNQHK